MREEAQQLRDEVLALREQQGARLASLETKLQRNEQQLTSFDIVYNSARDHVAQIQQFNQTLNMHISGLQSQIDEAKGGVAELRERRNASEERHDALEQRLQTF